MRKSRFSDEQMVAILRGADRTTVTAAAKKNNVREQTIYAWRKQFGLLELTDVKALKALSAENAKLKKLLAERDLEMKG
jgi:putative transposase